MFFFQDTLKTAFETRIQPIDGHKQQFFPKIRALYTLPLLQKSAMETYLLCMSAMVKAQQ